MAARPPIQVRYAPSRVYDVFQGTYVGAQTDTGKRGWWPACPVVNTGFAAFQNGIAIHGGHLIAGGNFTTMGGTARPAYGVADIATGALLTQNHTFSGVGQINCVETDGTYAYVGGSFTGADGVTTIAGRSISGLVRFDYNGVLDQTWNPAPNLSVTSVELLRYNPTNGTMYVAGDGLTTLNGTARTRIGEVSLTDAGNATAWTADPNGRVRTIYVDEAGARVYLGGAFTTIDGAAQVRLTRMTMSGTGAADVWAPAPDNTVRDVLKVGDLLYVVGDFLNIGSTPAARNRAATVTPSGTVGAWNPNLDNFGSTLALYRDRIFLGGAFTTVGATGRAGLAALTLTGAGTLQAWNPGVSGGSAVVVKMLFRDRTLYCAGNFTTINGVAKTHLGIAPFPIFTDSNTKYVAKTGSDAAAGTAAAPYLTIAYALSQLAGAFTFVVIQDSGEYNETLSVAYNANEAGGVFAADGEAPTITPHRGHFAGTVGARVSGRTKFSTGAAATFYYVSKVGDDATGARGNSSLPFLTIAAALADGARLADDTIQIQDSGRYVEDLNAAALAVTIQAKDGEMPTIARLGAGDSIIANAGIAVRLYGLTLDGGAPTTTGHQFVVTTGNLDVYDCTFLGGNDQINWTGAFTLNVYNCEFVNFTRFGTVGNAITSTGAANETVTIQNCTFDTPSALTAVFFVRSAGVLTLTVRWCTFAGCTPEGTGANAGSHLMVDGGGAHVMTVKDCAFRDDRAVPLKVNAIATVDAINAAATLLIQNCLFYRIGGAGYSVVTGGSPVLTVRDCAFVECTSAAATVGSLGLLADNSLVEDCVFVDPNYAGIVSAVTVGLQVDVNRIAVVNAGTYGVVQVTGTGTVVVSDWIEYGSAGGGTPALEDLAGAAQSSHGVHQKAVAGVVSLGGSTVPDVTADPQLVSTAVGDVNPALLPTSVGIGFAATGEPVGPTAAIIAVASAADPFEIDGLILSGDIYFYGGLRMERNLASRVDVGYCDFVGLGPFGASLTGMGRLSTCRFKSPNGNAIIVVESGAEISRCVVYGAASAGILLAATASVEHVTVYSCAYGQYDANGATARVQKNNVLAGNGANSAADYFGDGAQANSVVPILDGGATVTNGSRNWPLFRDLAAAVPDLRVQAIAVGYPYDSPAKGLADDDGDAGAYEFYYGPVTLTWTTLDMGTAGYRNPDRVTRTVRAIKPAEGDTWGARTYSTAQAYKTEHGMTWDSVNDMPEAQRAAIEAVYNTGDGETQVSFDGGTTWIPTRVLRSEELRYEELEGLPYSDDTVPRPIGALTFRESV